MIYQQLFGAIKARDYFDVKFNIKNEKLEDVKEFLISRRYCSQEPTIVKGMKFSQVNVLIPKNKFPEMLSGIKSLGASSIVREKVKQYVE